MSTTAVSRPKLVYLAERPADRHRAEFVARWRAHARLGMSQDRWQRNVHRYVHCDAMHGEIGPFEELSCDGVAMVWYRDEEARMRHAADPASAIMKADERDTFARPVRETAMLVDEQVFRSAVLADHVLIVRISFPEQVAQWSRDTWADQFGPLVSRHLSERLPGAGYVQNFPREGAGLGAGEACFCMDEVGLPTGQGNAASVYFDAMQKAGVDMANIHLHAVMTRCNVLYPVEAS